MSDEKNQDIFDKLPLVALPDESEIGYSGMAFLAPLPEPKEEEKPGFGETLGANVRMFSDAWRATKQLAEGYNPYRDSTIEEGYDPLALLGQVRPEDKTKILQTTSLLEGQAVLNNILQEYEDKDIRDRSGWFANATTTLGASLISPTWAIPFSQTVKYAQVTKGAFVNALNTAKYAVPAIALQNAILTSTKETEGLKEWVQDTLVESFIAAGIGGAVGAFAAKGVQKSTAKVKAMFDSVEDGIGVRHVMNPDGSVQKLEAFELPGSGSVGAAANERLRRINDILDTVNPLENNPYTKKFFGWAHPIMQGISSRFSVVREMTDLLNAHNFRVAGGDINKIRDAAAENFQRLWRNQNSSLMFQTDQAWLKYIGAEGLGGDIKAEIGTWQGKFIAKKDFREMVGKAIRRNGETGEPLVDGIAKKWINELYDPLWDELKKRRPDLSEHEFTNIKRYLNRIYDKPLVQQSPAEFLNDYKAFLGDVNMRVFAWQNKLDSLAGQRKTLRKRLKLLKEQTTRSKDFLPHPDAPPLSQLKAERRQVEKDIRKNREYQQKVDAEIAEKIKTGEIDLAMLSEKPNLTQAQIEQVEKFNAPIEKAREEFENALDEYRAFNKRKATPQEVKLHQEKWNVVEQKRADLEKAKQEVKQKQASPEANAKVNQAQRNLEAAQAEYKKLKATRIEGPEYHAKQEAKKILSEKKKALSKAEREMHQKLGSPEFNASVSAARKEFNAAVKEYKRFKISKSKARQELDESLREYRKFGKRTLIPEQAKLREEARKVVQEKRAIYKAEQPKLQAEARKKLEDKRAAYESEKKKIERIQRFPHLHEEPSAVAVKRAKEAVEKAQKKFDSITEPTKETNLRERARQKVENYRQELKAQKEKLFETLRSKEFNASVTDAEAALLQAEKDFNKLGSGRTTEEKALREDARKAVHSKREAYRKKKAQLQRVLASERLDEKIWWKRAAANGDLKYGLKNPKKGRLRRVMDEADVEQRAMRSMDTILQQNDDQLVGQMFDAIQAGGPSTLKERTMLWNDELAEKWLINDIDRLGSTYMNQMVNRIHLDDAFRKFAESGTPEEGKKNIASMLLREYKEQQLPLLKKEQTPEIKKQLAKLDKDFEKAQKFMEKMYKTSLGDFGDRSAVSFRITNSLKEMAVATMLGNLPILELAEFFTPLFKFTFSEYIEDGLVPMLRYWNELKRTGKVDRAAFQDLGVGHNVAHGKWQQVLNGNSPQALPKTVTERYIKSMANLSNNISMANHIMDFQEVMVAFMSQAKTLRILEKFEKGESLSASDIARFDELRLSPIKYGKQILEQTRKHGEKFEGGLVANWHLWDKEAFEAQQAFKIAIEKETRSLITKPNNLDLPFGFKDNILASLATQFMSFPFSATLNFTIPTLTNPDSQKFIGALMTIASSSMIDPLRQLAKGEDVNLDPKALATSAFTNSGFFGWQADSLQRLNSALDLPFMRPFQGDRFRKKDPWSLVGGPTAGMMGDIATTLSALANGDITRRDADKIFRYMVPFSGSYYLRQPVSAMIDSIGLPETRKKRG